MTNRPVFKVLGFYCYLAKVNATIFPPLGRRFGSISCMYALKCAEEFY